MVCQNGLHVVVKLPPPLPLLLYEEHMISAADTELEGEEIAAAAAAAAMVLSLLHLKPVVDTAIANSSVVSRQFAHFEMAS